MREKRNVEIGATIGKRTILKELRGFPRRKFEFRCVCGHVGKVCITNLDDGQGCGCQRGHKLKIISGQVIGKRTILKELKTLNLFRRRFRYQCVCGKIGVVALNRLQDGCGCGCGHHGRPPIIGWHALTNLLSTYKVSAKRRSLAWELTREHFRAIVTLPCHYCGAQPSRLVKAGNNSFVYNGVDRVNNAIGYTAKNTVSCCQTCNYAKRQMTVAEFKTWISRVYWHFNMDMDNLYNKVDTSEKFTAEKVGIPVKDQSGNAAFGLDWASRQQSRPQEAPAPQRMPPIIPVAN